MIRFQPRLALLLCCAAVSSQVFADQNGTSQPQQRRQDDDLIRSIGHLERPDQAPAEPAPQLSMSVVPQSGPFRAAIFESVQVNVDSLGFNIPGDAANEPSIAIDPNFPTRIVIGWRQFDTVASNFRQAGWAFSQDGGLSWAFGGSLEPGEFSSDPVLDFDRQGNFYYYALQPIRGPVDWTCYLYKSFDGGITWPQEVYAFGGDKAWMAIDRGVTWSQNVPLSPSFDSFVGWPNQNKLGDYYEMISDNAGANLAYAATFNGEQDVYFLRIPFDCNENGIPDDCDISCGAGGGRCDVPGCGTSGDCNANAAPDDCEPDFDCNGNGIQDICDIASGFSFDCNGDLEPDECPGCTDDCECTEIDPCWYGVCLAGACQVSPGIYGDTNHDGSVNVFDIFCILDGIAGQFSECGFDDIDIHPCGGNGTANLFDAFAVLEAITGIDACCGS